MQTHRLQSVSATFRHKFPTPSEFQRHRQTTPIEQESRLEPILDIGSSKLRSAEENKFVESKTHRKAEDLAICRALEVGAKAPTELTTHAAARSFMMVAMVELIRPSGAMNCKMMMWAIYCRKVCSGMGANECVTAVTAHAVPRASRNGPPTHTHHRVSFDRTTYGRSN